MRIYQSELMPEVIVLEGGVGKKLSHMGTLQLIERFRPDMVISAGFAGGAMPGSTVGDAFFCDRLVSVNGPLYLWEKNRAVEHFDPELPERIRSKFPSLDSEYKIGACLTVPQFISSSSMKLWLGETFQVRLIDMESYWVFEAAKSAGVPQLSLKVILDPVEQSLPGFVSNTMFTGGAYRAVMGAAYVARNPFEVRRLFRLNRQVKRSRKILADFLFRIVAEQGAAARW